jgi:hypothetical protein
MILTFKESLSMSLSNRHRLKARESVTTIRRKRGCATEVGLLEGRLLLSGISAAPITTLEVIPNTLNRTGYYTASPETVELIAHDAASPNGLMTFYNVDHTGFVEGNSFQLLDGIHTVQFFSVNQSGSREIIHTKTIKIDSTSPIVTASANPSTLWPPNHKFVPVTVTGHVSDASGGLPRTVSYRVIDEYGQVQPRGTARVASNGNYSFVVELQSSRLGQDKDGRQYTIVVSATDEAGNTGSAKTFVVVPHDQGNQGGNGQGGNGQGDGNGNPGNGHGKGNGHKHG